MDEYKNIKIVWKPITLKEDAVLDGSSVRLNTRTNYEAQSVDITVSKSGSIFFSATNREDFIYFYPDQLKHVRRALDMAYAQRRKKIKRALKTK